MTLLDTAIEDLAALAGDPVADTKAAAAADDSLVLGHIYLAYLQLYGMTPEGVATAGEILKRLDETAMGERELHHLRAARHWSLPPLLSSPTPTSPSIAQDLTSSSNRSAP